MKIGLCMLVLLIVGCECGFTPNCGFSYSNGTYVSLITLATKYSFVNTPPSHVPPQYEPQNNVTLEIQICGSLNTSFPSLCTNANSAVNIIGNGTCTSGGDVNVGAWELNPSGNGISLIYYHGDWVSPTQGYSTRIYFECQENITDDQAVLTYEFLNPLFYQYHLIIYTQQVCADYAVSPPSTTPPPVICGTSIWENYFLNLSSTVISSGGNLYPNITGTYPDSNVTQPPITIEAQICGNVNSYYASLCTIPSPANVINTTANTCTNLGDITAYAWDLNPNSGAGVNLIFYHGALVGTVETLQTRIYFECPPLFETPLSQNVLHYEHYAADAFSYHFAYITYAACPPNRITTSTTSANTSSASILSSSSVIFFIFYAILVL